jgi:hypothetical protein
MHLQLQATINARHAALSPLLDAWAALPGPAFLASLPYHLFHLDLTNLQRLAHNTTLDEHGADEDADDDIQH